MATRRDENRGQSRWRKTPRIQLWHTTSQRERAEDVAHAESKIV